MSTSDDEIAAEGRRKDALFAEAAAKTPWLERAAAEATARQQGVVVTVPDAGIRELDLWLLICTASRRFEELSPRPDVDRLQ